MDRRDVLRGALAFTLGTPTAAFVVYDPVMSAINAYKAGVKAFNASPDEKADEFNHLWLEPYDRLTALQEAATTKEGALAALRLAIEEDEVGDSPMIQPLIKAALGYLEAA